MSGLEVRNVVVRFESRVVLDGATLTVERGEIVGLLGSSGSGKSTLLRVIAGLQKPERGTVGFDGADITDVAAHERNFGLVFQDQQLFTHLDVAANVAFAFRRLARAERRARVAELLSLVGLDGYESRSVVDLSGGEAQRVALARAFGASPRLLLLDEPLGALDRDLHDRLASDLRALLKRQGITAVHVTHDHSEARVVCDRAVELRDGVVHADVAL